RDPSLLDRDYARALHCDGFKCWWDKPQNMFFSANGKYTSTAEHSVCDALIFVHLSEYQKYHENFTLGFTTEGHARGAVELVPQPQRIRFDIAKDTQVVITKTLADNLTLVQDYDNAAFVFYDYGKNFIKKCKVSPDAYIQMAIQIAYYKDQKKFPLTYEPTMARLWRDGRTETVRSCTEDSVDFVMAMLDSAASREEKLSKLRAACEVHQQNYRDSMAGRGCDRHLFALRVVSRYYGIESPFLDAVFAQSFELSTSQTPQHQQEDIMKALADQKDFFWPSGSFACPDGSKYGVCYTVGSTGDILSFHISTWHSVADSDAKRFRSTLMNTLREMKQLLGGSDK
uniref:Choline/carnitine acyltransferase domain-containing protein n=1 Tax=Plectus sambesii TaxID=2011161 RepID=A0A914VZT0_9BILA